jgi:hypothetical protein
LEGRRALPSGNHDVNGNLFRGQFPKTQINPRKSPKEQQV